MFLSNDEWYKFCTHLRSFNVRHFGMDESMELKFVAPRSSSIALLHEYTDWFKRYLGEQTDYRQTDRQTDYLVSLEEKWAEEKINMVLSHFRPLSWSEVVRNENSLWLSPEHQYRLSI
jgi:hypothetical protein